MKAKLTFPVNDEAHAQFPSTRIATAFREILWSRHSIGMKRQTGSLLVVRINPKSPGMQVQDTEAYKVSMLFNDFISNNGHVAA